MFPGSGPVVTSGGSSPPAMVPPMSGPRAHFQFKFDSKTPLAALLPVAPKSRVRLLPDDLAHVPEVSFQPPIAKGAKALEQTAYTIAKIKHVNGKKKTDAYLEALMKHRADLSGLPFTLGDACRMKGERGGEFAGALNAVRAYLNQQVSVPVADASNKASESFWTSFRANCGRKDAGVARTREQKDNAVRGRISALMQVLGPDTPAMRRGLVRFLSTVAHPEATKALARLAIFSAEEEIRQDAIDALKVRRDKDYTDILRDGLRYPWPAIAQRASEALVKLERSDLVPELVAMLDEADPRAAVVKKVDGKNVPVVRELVRINHHRNCVMCHAPETPSLQSGMAVPQRIAFPPRGPGPSTGMNASIVVANNPLAAQIPIPGEPLPTPSQGYGSSNQDILVRIDVTYLKQDFSLMQRVADAQPWPEMQRFDFLVRSRVVTEAEAAANREELKKRITDGQTPYQRAAHLALRDLTGRDAAANAAAWRRALNLDVPAQK